MALAQAGQAEQATHRLLLQLQGLQRGDEGQAGALHRGLAVQPPEAVAQRQRLAGLQGTGEAGTHALHVLEHPGALPGQVFQVLGIDGQLHQFFVQCQRLGRALQQVEDLLGFTGLAQGLLQIALAQGAGQQLQDAQVFVGFGGDGDGQVGQLTITPVYSVRELHHPHAGDMHLVAGLRRTMGNGDTLAEVGGALGLAGLEPFEITRGDQAIGHQGLGEHGQGGRLVRRLLGHADMLGIEFEHGRIPPAPRA